MYYYSGGSLISAKLSVTTSGATVLRRDTIFAGTTMNHAPATFDVFDASGNGTRFLALVSERSDLQLVVVPNWISEVRTKLAAAKT